MDQPGILTGDPPSYLESLSDALYTGTGHFH
jgi:hypothetical protein